MLKFLGCVQGIGESTADDCSCRRIFLGIAPLLLLALLLSLLSYGQKITYMVVQHSEV